MTTPPRTQPIAYILSEVAKNFGMTEDDLLMDARGEPVRTVRNCAMYLARRITKAELTRIAAVFKRDHSSVYNAHETIQKMRSTNLWLSFRLQELQDRLCAELFPAEDTIEPEDFFPQESDDRSHIATVNSHPAGAKSAAGRIDA